MARPRLNRIGERHGKLLVIGRGRTELSWICKCDCGNVIECTSHQLSGKNGVKQCGCSQKHHTSNKFQGCDEDCFRCIYDECLKPGYQCTYIPEVEPIW